MARNDKTSKEKQVKKEEKPLHLLLRKNAHEEHEHIPQLTAPFRTLEGIEHEFGRVHRHEFHDDEEDDDEVDDSQDDATTFLDQEGHELREFNKYEFTEKNPGCWIFGHGEVHILPPEFTNPLYVAQFAKKITIVMAVCLFSRTICLSLVVFIPQVHEAFFNEEFYNYPLLISFFCFFMMEIIIHLPVLEQYIRHFPANAIVFILTEISYTSTLIGLSLLLERVSHNWIVSLDLYKEYRIHNKTVGFPGALPENFPKYKITPAFFFISANIQIMINLAAFVILTRYTKYWMGSKVAYEFVFGFTLGTSIMVMILLFDYSYATVKMWDRLQLLLSVSWTLLTSYLFIHYIERVVEGKILRLYGMKKNDVCNAALRLCFL